MCDVAQRLEDKGRSEGRIEERIEVLVTLVKSGSITVDTAAGILKITTTEFKKYLQQHVFIKTTADPDMPNQR